jgi:hypothetical protein
MAKGAVKISQPPGPPDLAPDELYPLHLKALRGRGFEDLKVRKRNLTVRLSAMP